MPIDRDRNEPLAQACRNFADRHVGRVASFLRVAGIGETTWNDWLNERTTVPGWAGRAIYVASADLQFFNEFSGAQDVGIVCSLVAVGSSIDDLRSAVLEANAAQGELARETIEAAADGHIDVEESRRIEARINAEQAKLEQARQTARRLVRRPVTVAAYRKRER